MDREGQQQGEETGGGLLSQYLFADEDDMDSPLSTRRSMSMTPKSKLGPACDAGKISMSPLVLPSPRQQALPQSQGKKPKSRRSSSLYSPSPRAKAKTPLRAPTSIATPTSASRLFKDEDEHDDQLIARIRNMSRNATTTTSQVRSATIGKTRSTYYGLTVLIT